MTSVLVPIDRSTTNRKSTIFVACTQRRIWGLSRANNLETQFDPRTVVLVCIDPVRDGYSPEKTQALFAKLPERLRASGIVRSFALAAQPPFAIKDDDETIPLTAEDSRESSRVQITAVEEPVGAGYFAVLNEPLLAGREFEEFDQRNLDPLNPDRQHPADGSRTVAAVLNESAARGFFSNEHAGGRHFRDSKRSYEVVGVVRDLKDGNGAQLPIVYTPLSRRDFAQPPAGGITVIARCDAGPDALVGIRNVIASIDPNLSLFDVHTLSEYLQFSRYLMWSALRTYGGIGLFGLVLSAIGLAGVTGYAVAQRRREIGIRMALGARKGQVLRLVLREGAALIAVGTTLGFLGAFALSRMLSALTSEFADAFKIGTNDPCLLFGAPLLLATLALLACYVPARTAAKIDPLKALREG